MFALPLQVIDNFLLQYNVGQAILLLFVLSMVGALPLKSGKVLSLNAILFGFIFLVTPGSLAPVHFKFLGIALVVVGSVFYATTR